MGGAAGGFTTGRAEIIELLRQRSRPYLFSNSLPPVIAAAALQAVKLVAQGRRYYDPAMIRTAWEEPRELGRLTHREREVLSSLGRGSKNSEIARELFITEFTVKKYVSQILDKLSLQDRTQAALWAVNNGLVRQGRQKVGL